MIERYYGKFGIQATYFDRETVRKSQNLYHQPNDFLKLRTLAQNELILQRDKNLLLWHYGIKSVMVLYWIFGNNNMASLAYWLISTVFHYFHEWLYFVIFVLSPFPDCENLFASNYEPTPSQIKECEYIDQLNRTAIQNNQTFSQISTFVKPEKLQPRELFIAISVIFGVIPLGIMRLNQAFYDTFISIDLETIKKKKREKRKLLRKARIAKELDLKLQDLSDYRLFFVGLEEHTSSDEERQLVKKYRQDYGDKGELLAHSSSDEHSIESLDADLQSVNDIIRSSEPSLSTILTNQGQGEQRK